VHECQGAFQVLYWEGVVLDGRYNNFNQINKKQGAAGITTAAPYVAGQWGRGEDRLPG
jgi:hypothetical protein